MHQGGADGGRCLNSESLVPKVTRAYRIAKRRRTLGGVARMGGLCR
jgi:hypothetical protein